MAPLSLICGIIRNTTHPLQKFCRGYAGAKSVQPAALKNDILIKCQRWLSRSCFTHLRQVNFMNALRKDLTKFKSVTNKNLPRCRNMKKNINPQVGAYLPLPGRILFGTFSLGFATFFKLHPSNFLQQVQCKKSKVQGRTTGLANEDEQIEAKFPWKEFFKLLAPDWFYLLAAVISALGVAYINVQIPMLLGTLVNVITKFTTETGNDFTAEVRRPAFQLVHMYGIQALLTCVYITLLSMVGERMAARMRNGLFESIIVQDIAFFDANKTGEIVNRMTSDVQDFKSSFKLCISQGLRSIAQTVGCLVSLFLISPKLTGLMAGVVAAMIGLGTLMGSGLRQLSRRAQAQLSRSTAVADEAIGNVRTVRAFAMESTEVELFTCEVQKSSHLNQILGVGVGVFQGLSNFALNVVVLGTLYTGGYLMSHQTLNAGDLMSFMVATQTIQRSLAQLSLLFGQAVRGLSAGSRVFEYMLLNPSMGVTGGQTIPYHSLRGNVEFKHVNFSYPTRPNQVVLKDFSLSIPGGRMVALVGLSGNGKSTVAALLERFYDVDSGSVTLDGQNIRTFDPSWLRGRAIGYINQEPVLFATTVMENIRYGRPNATDYEVMEAAKKANAHSFITTFPEGYNTVLGERGVTVSGGQKQRIAIARALIKNPAILLLDEATSALDAESERVVQEALDNVVKGRTVLVIAHRLSTIKNADVIAVVSNGQIVEIGTHDELRRKQGAYWKLIRKQDSDDSVFPTRTSGK